jgi:hypothetical protein
MDVVGQLDCNTSSMVIRGRKSEESKLVFDGASKCTTVEGQE